jgi:F-type H+-transporting ATPase subunit c
MRRVVFVIINFIVLILIASASYAQIHVGGGSSSGIYLAMAAALTIAIAAFAGAMAQAKTASSALEGIARNPEAAGKVMTPMIIALALIESLVIYALVIAFLLQAKI